MTPFCRRSVSRAHTDLTTYLHALWYCPLEIALALFFLWKQLGASSFGGVAVIIVMVPATKSIAQWMGGMQKKLMQAKDARVELNSEVLSGMKVIKLQAWEESFQKRILNLREVELQNLLRYFVGVSYIIMISLLARSVASLLKASRLPWSYAVSVLSSFRFNNRTLIRKHKTNELSRRFQGCFGPSPRWL